MTSTEFSLIDLSIPECTSVNNPVNEEYTLNAIAIPGTGIY